MIKEILLYVCLSVSIAFSFSASAQSYQSNKQLSESCEEGNRVSCIVLKVRKKDNSDGGDISTETLKGLIENCETDAESCYLISSIYTRGQGVPRNDILGAKYAELACRQGIATSCLLEAEALYFSSTDKAKFERQYSQAYKRACEFGLAEGCANLFDFYYQKELVRPGLIGD